MGFQVVVKAVDAKIIERALGEICALSELFPLGNGDFGLSIPTKLFDALGDQEIYDRMAKLEHYDLCEGAWHTPTSKRRLW